MKLNAPKKIVWIISLIVGNLGILGALITVPIILGISLWIVAAAWLPLILATYFTGL
jgi:uncharacterized protein (DUF983 family)